MVNPGKPSDRHRHKCDLCGTVWSHGRQAANDQNEHTCPTCGNESYATWLVYTGPIFPKAESRNNGNVLDHQI